MRAIVYTKPNCSYCVNAKKLLEKMKIGYLELVLDEDFTREELLKNFPDAKTFPQIILDEEHIGGFTDLAKRFG